MMTCVDCIHFVPCPCGKCNYGRCGYTYGEDSYNGLIECCENFYSIDDYYDEIDENQLYDDYINFKVEREMFYGNKSAS